MGLLDKILNKKQPVDTPCVQIPSAQPPPPIPSNNEVVAEGKVLKEAGKRKQTEPNKTVPKNELQKMIDNATARKELHIPAGKGEIEGPAEITKPLTLVGNGCFIHAMHGPVLSILSKDVTIRDCCIEVAASGYPDSIDCKKADAVAVYTDSSPSFDRVFLVGNVKGVSQEEGDWHYPKSLNLGRMEPKKEYQCTMRCVLPVSCEIQSDIKGLKITPTKINTKKPTDIELLFDPFSPNTIISGWLYLKTKQFTRKIKVNANIAATPGKGAKAGTKKFVYKAPEPKPPPQVAAPSFTPASGNFASVINVQILCKDSQATIYYTVDGSEPTKQSSVFKDPLMIDKSVAIHARAFSENKTPSSVISAKYDIVIPPPQVAKPTLLPDGGIFDKETQVALNCSTSNAVIHYTRDGSEPNESSPIYRKPIRCKKDLTLKARAFCEKMVPSEEVTGIYEIILPLPPTPPKRQATNFKSGKSTAPSVTAWKVHEESSASDEADASLKKGSVFSSIKQSQPGALPTDTGIDPADLSVAGTKQKGAIFGEKTKRRNVFEQEEKEERDKSITKDAETTSKKSKHSPAIGNAFK
ncbi:MAG: hypothetical protein EOM12_05640 [Verrucomicrobiae bacterium]|nr:hypothetical protein [Verrucomicrobiae bacterium]